MTPNTKQLAVLRRVAAGGISWRDLSAREKSSAWALYRGALVARDQQAKAWIVTEAGRRAVAAADLADARAKSIETERQRLAAGDRS